MTPDQLNAAEAAWRKANPGETPTTEQITGQAYQALYDQAFKESGFGTGGKYQQGIQAVTAAVQGLAGGDITAALAGGANPYIAGIIKSQTGDNVAANAVAHALWGGVSALLQGNGAAAGAAGATAGELAARVIAGQLYPDKKPSELSESEKQTVSVLATAAAGLAGGMAGGGTADTVAGAQAGKNSVDNNALGDGWNTILPSGAIDYGQSVQSYAEYARDKNLPPEQVQADLARMVKGDLPEGADIIKAILSNNPGSDTVMALLDAKDAKDYALALLTSIPAEKVLSLLGKASKVIDNKALIKAAEKISTAKPGKQFTVPRDLNEQVLWNQVKENPSSGHPLKGMNTDPRFPTTAGFQKMATSHTLPDGSNIEIHYQYNAVTNKAYDVKIVTPKRSDLQPGPSLKEKS